MSSNAKSVRVAALRLPMRSRAKLAADLIDSLDGESDDPAEVEGAWAKEIERRLAEFDSGKVKSIPWAEARRRIAAAARPSRAKSR